MTSIPTQRIGIVTSDPAKLDYYFPTVAEPEFIPTEPPFTPDDQLLVDELRRRGHQVSAVVWGSDIKNFVDRFDRIIIRSPWDYMDSDELRHGFLRWLAALAKTGISVENEPRLMLWLMDKRYLLDFATVDVPIVPTQAVSAGESLDLVAFVGRHAGAVVKPAVSASGAGLEFLPDCDAARAFQHEFDVRCQRGVQLVQPFLPEIKTNGEWSLVYLGGAYSHAVHKAPAAGQIMVHAERGGSLCFAEPPLVVSNIGDRTANAVTRAFAHCRGEPCRRPLYLRIDVIETATGGLLSECEGVEPELFFRARPGSAGRFADLIEIAGF